MLENRQNRAPVTILGVWAVANLLFMDIYLTWPGFCQRCSALRDVLWVGLVMEHEGAKLLAGLFRQV